MSAPHAWRGLSADRKAHKYGAKPQRIDGLYFASQAEARRYAHLVLSERAGIISDLDRQVRFPLVINGVKIGTYVADATYTNVATGYRVVEDVKGAITPVYRIKRALMKALHNIEIYEVRA